MRSSVFVIAASLAVGLALGFPQSGPADSLASRASSKAALEQLSGAFNEIARMATPSVVSINTLRITSAKRAALGLHAPPPDDDLPLPFPLMPPGHDGPGGPGGPGEDGMGVGSGVIIREDGLILTSNHVVDHAQKITVSFDDKKRFRARVVGSDSKTDVALLKLDHPPTGLVPLRFGDSDRVAVGDWAVAIGNPFGLAHTVTSGIVSAKGRGQMGVVDVEDFIQTDAAINPGNSGGPLLNLRGDLIGLNAAIFSQTGGFIGIGFAVPSNIVKDVTDQLLAHGRVIRGWAGVLAQDMSPELARHFRVPLARGALISQVLPQGPADSSDMKVGDVIVTFDSHPVDGATDLRNRVGRSTIGARIPVGIYRAGASRTLVLAIREQPAPLHPDQLAGKAGVGPVSPPPLGLALENVPNEISRLLRLGPDEGVLVIGVRAGGVAFEAGLAPGDVILKVNDTAIHGIRDFMRFAHRFHEAPEPPVLYVQRGPEGKIFVPLESRES